MKLLLVCALLVGVISDSNGLNEPLNSDPISPKEEHYRSRRLIQVPHQCPIGYRADRLGYCRQIMKWTRSGQISPQERYGRQIIEVPRKCPVDYMLIGGRFCVPDDGSGSPQEQDGRKGKVIDIPRQCPQGYKADARGNCRPIATFRSGQISPQDRYGRRVIDIPRQCPQGYKADSRGNCRPIAKLNP